jgi:hypothetical protein
MALTNDTELTAPAVIVSCDGHVGPKLKDQLRPYCPQRYLQAFDAYVAEYEAEQEALRSPLGMGPDARLAALFREHPNMRTPGHYDVDVRLQDMDRDGVAAELMWHSARTPSRCRGQATGSAP